MILIVQSRGGTEVVVLISGSSVALGWREGLPVPCGQTTPWPLRDHGLVLVQALAEQAGPCCTA